jgi:hypothetical protein
MAIRKYWIHALSLSNLCFFNAWREALSPYGLSYLYFWKEYPGYAILGALLLNVLLLASVFLVGIYLLTRFGGVYGHKVGQVLFLLVFLRACNHIRTQFESLRTTNLRLVFGRPGYVVLVSLVIFGIGLALARYKLDGVTRACALILLVLSPFGIIGITQATWLAITYGQMVSRDRPLARSFDHPDNARPRVLWLIFDEMGEQLAFASRPANLNMPEFDRMRTESLFATNAFPPAGHTSQSIPALLTGELISSVRPVSPREVMLTISDSEAASGWSTHADLFSDARALRLNTALIGWYNPYCRVIEDRLTSCSWEPASQRIDSTKLSIHKNLIRQDEDLLNLIPFIPTRWKRLPAPEGRNIGSEHLADYLTILGQAEEAVANMKFDLLFVHMPVPHPPWIYNRSTREVTAAEASGYLGNLALADIALGRLRKRLEETGAWDRTSIVISSDHWWRSDYWRDRIPQTADQPVQAEKVDHRVPFIIRLAGQKKMLTYDSPFNTVLTRGLIREVLSGKISQPDDVAMWLEAHRTIGESPYQSYEDAAQ